MPEGLGAAAVVDDVGRCIAVGGVALDGVAGAGGAAAERGRRNQHDAAGEGTGPAVVQHGVVPDKLRRRAYQHDAAAGVVEGNLVGVPLQSLLLLRTVLLRISPLPTGAGAATAKIPMRLSRTVLKRILACWEWR